MSGLSMFLRCTILVLGLFCAATAAAELRVFADPMSLDETETLRLTLRLEGRRNAPAPELDALERDFEVLGSSSSSQYRSINGQVKSWIEYQISLRPKRAGQLVIPALELGGERSNPLTVDVRPLDPQVKRSIDELVFFETEVTPSPVYVQAELRVIRRLYYATNGGVQMYSDLPGAPEIPDAVVLTLGDATSFPTQRNGVDYGVVEQRFAVYPERSGQIEIPSVALTTSVRVERNGRYRRSGVRVRSEPLTVDVLPIPDSYPADAPWLPATSVQLTQTLSPAGDLRTGSTAELTLSAAVTGNVASAIAPIELAVPDSRFRVYPGAPQTEDDVVGRGLVGTRTQTLALVPIEPGPILIPGAELVWWNTRTATVERTQAQPLALSVVGAAVKEPTGPSDGIVADARGTDGRDSEAEPPPREDATSRDALIAAVVLVLLALSGILWRLFKRAQRQPRHPSRKAAHPATRRRIARKRFEALLDEAGDPLRDRAALATVRQGLIEAVRFVHGGTAAEAIHQLQRDPTGKTVLTRLSEAAFGATQAAASSAPALDPISRAEVLPVLERAIQASKSPSSADPLPPLYPA
ncbi:MAG: BatD family protein [Pseudomonadota bacterium]